MRHSIVVVAWLLAACGDDGPGYSPERLQDPGTCLACHPTHHADWSGSMHAYATTDPVFRAMHKRGQRETNGELGMFCVTCHAPMAVATGVIDETNVRDFDFATLEPKASGITCYFCHNIDRVVGEHDNPLELAMDQTMRGGVKDPVSNPAHHSAYAQRMDNDATENKSEMCGACHDIVNPAGVAVERTFAEYRTSVFYTAADKTALITCGSCHMAPFDDLIADGPGLDVTRRPLGRHDHKFPAIDLALDDFPGIAAQDSAVKTFLAGTVAIKGPKPRDSNRQPGGICEEQNGDISVRIDSFHVGHGFPSGAAFDRRSWIELIAYDAEVGGNVVFQSGVVPDGMDPTEIGDPKLAGFWDRAKKADGSVAHFLWEVASIEDKAGDVVPTAVTFDQTDPRFDHSVTRRYTNAPLAQIKRMEARLLVRPLNYEMLRALVASGDLDASALARVQTMVVSTSTWLESTKGTGLAAGTRCNPK